MCLCQLLLHCQRKSLNPPGNLHAEACCWQYDKGPGAEAGLRVHGLAAALLVLTSLWGCISTKTYLPALCAGTVAAINYTPANAGQLFIDSGISIAQQLGPLLIGNFTGNNSLPHTNFYGFIGTGAQ